MGFGEFPALPEQLPLQVPDVHCHLDIIETDPGVSIAQASSVGIAPLVTIGCDVPSSRFAVQTASSHEDVFAAVAIHPNEAPRSSRDDLSIIEALATRERVVAIGETGLDHFRSDPEDWPVQEEFFRAHIEIAKAHDKALVIHDRDAHTEVMAVLTDAGAPNRTVMHCFSGDVALVRECAARGFAISFAGNVTFKNAASLREAAAAVPTELILVETDSPFLTPVPERGKQNSPYVMCWTVRALAEIRQVALETMCQILTENAEEFFQLPRTRPPCRTMS